MIMAEYQQLTFINLKHKEAGKREEVPGLRLRLPVVVYVMDFQPIPPPAGLTVAALSLEYHFTGHAPASRAEVDFTPPEQE